MKRTGDCYGIYYRYNGGLAAKATGLTKAQAKSILHMYRGKNFADYLKKRNGLHGFAEGVARENRAYRIMNKGKHYETIFDEPEEYEIASWYLSALINGDYSSFDYYATSEAQSERMIKRFDRWVKNTQDGREGHWSYFSEDDEDEENREKAGEHLAYCDISGKMADCETVVFHPQRKVLKPKL
jgi:hypothetical protein